MMIMVLTVWSVSFETECMLTLDLHFSLVFVDSLYQKLFMLTDIC